MANKTNMTYHGKVKIKLKINGKLYEIASHNEGLDYIFNLFAVFITGNYVNGALGLPQFLDLKRADSTDGEFNSYLTSLSPLTGKRYYQSGSDWIGEFTSVISSSQLLDIIKPDDTGIYYIYLLTGYNENEVTPQKDVARIQVPVSSLSQITEGITATIVWSLMITNE